MGEEVSLRPAAKPLPTAKAKEQPAAKPKSGGVLGSIVAWGTKRKEALQTIFSPSVPAPKAAARSASAKKKPAGASAAVAAAPEAPVVELPPAPPITAEAAREKLVRWSLGLGGKPVLDIEVNENIEKIKKGLDLKRATALGISPELFAIIDRNMEVSGKGDNNISDEELITLARTIDIYASNLPMDPAKAFELYNNSKTFTTEEVSSIRSRRDPVMTGLGVNPGLTCQQILEKIPDAGCRAALNDFILALHLDLTKKPDADAYGKITSRITAFPLIARLDADLQLKYFDIKVPLKKYTATELTNDKIQEYLGIKTAAAAAGTQVASAKRPGANNATPGSYLTQ